MMRRLHRWVATLAAAFLFFVAGTGGLLAVDNLAVALRAPPAGQPQFRSPVVVRAAAQPLSVVDLPRMIEETLSAVQVHARGVPVRAIQVRYFGSMPQGVIITDERAPRQLVFDLRNGRMVGFDEPEYPAIRFLFPWSMHETLKKLHRGDLIGMSGRTLDLTTGMCLLFLVVSGLWLYVDLYRRRLKARRFFPFWL